MVQKRVFLIVLDSFGAGALPDAASFGDEGSNTVMAVSSSEYFNCPNLIKLGLFDLPDIARPKGGFGGMSAYGRAAEQSAGKDTTVGHWEIAGVVTRKPFPTYPNGFPKETISEFERLTGRKVICNKPYSGTVVINDYGDEALRENALIVYTSADSVFQIAAHRSQCSLDELYSYCKIARSLVDTARVIARPYDGVSGAYYRTDGRKDFSLAPAGETILDIVSSAGMDVITVGKIENIFSGRGITRSYHTDGNTEGISYIDSLMKTDFNGLCFVNLVDFDMKYGHRNDIDGYAKAISEFDGCAGRLIADAGDDDLVIITADHGCDPSTQSTDHSREYIPIFIIGKGYNGFIGTRSSFSDIGATVCRFLGVRLPQYGVPITGAEAEQWNS